MRRRGFTLVELLVVLAIMAVMLALVVGSFPRDDARRQAVRAAAEELAATCRLARAAAVTRVTTMAVAFHIENAPGSSGRVLNNRSGGHWYRVLGPNGETRNQNLYHRHFSTATTVDNLPALTGPLNSGMITARPYTLFQYAELNQAAWQGPARVLLPGKVRFLALSDMDYGDYGYNSSTRARTATATASYPRPWFGWYDQATRRLHAWGGWDPAIPGSGFYYRGNTAATAFAVLDDDPLGCVNPAKRQLDHWVDGQQGMKDDGKSKIEAPAVAAGDPNNVDVLYAAGSPRPLVNASWRDFSLVFRGDGQVEWGGCMPGRHCSMFRNDNPSLTPSVNRGAAERCNGQFTTTGVIDQHAQSETGNFDVDSGGWFITLAPDVANDDDTFPTATKAVEALMPLYRVFVSALGEVRVIAVSRTTDWGTATAWPAAASDWAGQLAGSFPRDRYLVAGKAVGSPITRHLTPEMLANRSVWLR